MLASVYIKQLKATVNISASVPLKRFNGKVIIPKLYIYTLIVLVGQFMLILCKHSVHSKVFDSRNPHLGISNYIYCTQFNVCKIFMPGNIVFSQITITAIQNLWLICLHRNRKKTSVQKKRKWQTW